MPGPLRSPELARKARERLPGLAVLFTSGYTENAIVHGGWLDPGVELLPKPYTREALARKIHHVLRNQAQRERAERREEEAEPAQVSPAPSAPASLQVLLVEDDPLIRANAAEMLDDLGHSVVEAANGAEALQALAAGRAEVLVVDVGLPDMSGAELARRVLALRPGVPIVFATGDNAVTAERGLDGAVLLMKPYGSADLAKAVMVAMGLPAME